MPLLQLWQKWMPKEKYRDYREPLMIHSLNIFPVSNHLEGLPKAEMVSGYLTSLTGFVFHQLPGLPLNSRELLAS